VSGCMYIHSTVSKVCPVPCSRMLGSISGAVYWTTLPFDVAMRFCHTSDAASASWNPAARSMPLDGSRPCVEAGRLPSCHELSARGRNVPPSPSNVSTHAVPIWFGDGRLVASSASSVTSEGTSVCTSGRAFNSRVSPCGSKRKLPDTPPTKFDDGSKPRGGLVKFVCCCCNRPSSDTEP
jgi:hypothetical protein